MGIAWLWADHSENADMWIAKFGAAHLQSLHSWLGIVTATLWVANTASAAGIFFLAPLGMRQAYRDMHVFVGGAAVALTLASVLLGFVLSAPMGAT